MAAAGLAPVTYLGGSLGAFAVVAALAWGSWRARRAVLPGWSGAPARLAEAVIGISALLAVAQALGSVGAFSRGPMLLASIGVGVMMGAVASWFSRASSAPRAPAVPRRVGNPAHGSSTDPTQPDTRWRGEVIVAALAAAVVAAQWVTHVAVAFSRGMTHADTLWYHAPYAARFVHDARITGLIDRADVIQAYFPLNAQLVQAIAILPFDRDVLAPLVNLGWAALAVLAAWCAGRRSGLGPLCVLGALVVLGLPMLAGTQPGQAGNDVTVAALLLASVALLLEGELAPAPTAVAGLAAGLALGTKLTVAVPVAVLTVGVVVLAVRARRPLSALVWTIALAVTGAYWFGRNWALAENPLPWFDLDLGPLSFSAAARERGASIAEHLTDGSVWSDLYLPGLADGLGRAWFVVLALGVAGAVVAIARKGHALERVAGLAVVGGLIAYVFTPSGGGFNFAFNLRYVAPTLLVGIVLLARAAVAFPTWARRGLLAVFGALVALNAVAAHHERVAAWPRGYLLWGVVVGLAVLGTVVIARRPPTRRRATTVGVAVALVAAVAWAGGWVVQRRYLDHRYRAAGLALDAVNVPFREVREERVAVFGTVEVYPMFGVDLSNRVDQADGRVERGRATRSLCDEFQEVRDGEFDYVVLTQYGVVFGTRPPEAWFTDSPAAVEIARDADNVVYRIDGPLHPRDCA